MIRVPYRHGSQRRSMMHHRLGVDIDRNYDIFHISTIFHGYDSLSILHYGSISETETETERDTVRQIFFHSKLHNSSHATAFARVPGPVG